MNPSRTLSVVPLHENVPVVLLYWMTPEPKRFVREIFVLRIPERVATFVFVVARYPERVEILPERVEMFPVAVAR